ncbi:MAG: TetR/AcrR family transcriptional regulator [Robiginitomaculum sp.]|nr:TetR/AcrR family transcriptional regulator [Robiginitomaculum sp.]MDQ7077424.1 TetR/AcrR family transcriptional regulator [Robiginitomaculum sp.]
MARPSKFNRDQAVEFAMNAFWKEGYEANSVKALSEKLGITRSSFYNAFGDREQLFDEALALYMRGSPDKALKEAVPGIPIKSLFTETFRTICKVRAADPEGRGCLVVNGVAELCGTHATLGPKLQAAMLANVKRFETLLQQGVANGELAPDTDVHTLALAVKNLLVGLNVLSKLIHDEEELWRTASTTLRALNLLEEA